MLRKRQKEEIMRVIREEEQRERDRVVKIQRVSGIEKEEMEN